MPERRRAVWLVGGIGALALAGAAAVFALKGRGTPVAGSGGLDPHSVAVLYFTTATQDSSLGLVADGLSEGLMDALAGVSALRVVSRGGAASVRGSDLPLDSVARLLAAGTLVRGEVEREGADVRVTVRLADGTDGAEIGRASFRQPASEALALRDSLVQQAARLVRERLGEEIQVRAARAGASSAEAWVQFQRAQRLTRQSDSVAAAGDAVLADRLAAQADSMAALAEARDERWAAPSVARGMVAYRRSRRMTDDPLAARPIITEGLEHVARALERDPQDADALELRGNLQYWSWLIGLEADPARADALLQRARADLERAVELRPLQAGAWATLSHLYNQTGSGTEVNFAARRAFEADAFLGNADVILMRLFYSSYDLAQFVDAERWCREGARRFPDNFRFFQCRLMMMTTRAAEPDPARARRLFDSLLAVVPEPEREYRRLEGQLMVAAVLARAGQTDSARAVRERSRGTPELDPSRDLALFGGFVAVLTGDTAAALEDLGRYLTANPSRRKNYREDPGWWFRPLERHPGFQRLVQ